jgi:methylmalonyl-CoA mutase
MQLTEIKYPEFDKADSSAWREKALSEIKDKSFEEILTRIIGKHISVDSYAQSYTVPAEVLSKIQQAQQKELGWGFLNVEELKSSRSKETSIFTENRDDIIEEITELIYKTQQLLNAKNNSDSNSLLEFVEVEVWLTPDYLLTIAKIRAVRFLIARLVAVYNSKMKLYLKGVTNETSYKTDNEHINIVRATTMAMSGIIGGCDMLHIVPFDKSDNEFSSRIARNTSLILAEEAYLREVNDPAAGSYFIENLTYELIKKSWGSFVSKTQ